MGQPQAKVGLGQLGVLLEHFAQLGNGEGRLLEFFKIKGGQIELELDGVGWLAIAAR